MNTKQFIFRDKSNRLYFWIALIGISLQIIVFKFLYPYADFFSDSYSYLSAADQGLEVSIWPIGYSKFLSFFHIITHSDTALVVFQYYLVEISALFFFFTIKYFCNPGKATSNILFIFLFFNPLFLYISNYINSDPLFAALSLLWFTQLIWIIYRPNKYQIPIQAVLLFLCFTVRNNAYYYPIVAGVAFFLGYKSWLPRIIGTIAPFLLIIPFVIHTRDAAFKMTGTKQFSLFTGWQIANNALYFYDKISIDSNELPSKETKFLDGLTKKYFKTLKISEEDYRDDLSDFVGNKFIRDSRSPLKQYAYIQSQYLKDSSSEAAWGRSSAIFDQYGSFIAKYHPLQYLWYFGGINLKKYLIPQLEKLEIYNLGQDQVGFMGQYWFDYPTPSVTSISKTLQGKILSPLPYLFLFLNILILFTWGMWFSKRSYALKENLYYNKAFLLSLCLIVLNFGFCVLATIIVFRYDFFPMIVLTAFSLLNMEWLEKKTSKKVKSSDNYGKLSLQEAQL